MEAGVGVEACHGLEQLAASKRFEMEGLGLGCIEKGKADQIRPLLRNHQE